LRIIRTCTFVWANSLQQGAASLCEPHRARGQLARSPPRPSEAQFEVVACRGSLGDVS